MAVAPIRPSDALANDAPVNAARAESVADPETVTDATTAHRSDGVPGDRADASIGHAAGAAGPLSRSPQMPRVGIGSTIHRVRDAWSRLHAAYGEIFLDDWSERQWMRARIFSLVFLGFLVGPIRQAFDANWSAPRQAAAIAGICAFGLAFGVVVWRNTPALHQNRARYAILVAVGLAVTLVGVGVDWVTGFAIFTLAMLLYNCDRRWWLPIVLGVPAASVVLNVVLGGSAVRDAVMFALPVLLIGAVQAAFFQQVRSKVELARARTELARLAVSEERLRIARDLHDILGQRLSAVSLKAELAARLVDRDPTRAATEMGEVAAVARHALADVRDTVSGYRSLTLGTEIETARALLMAAGVSVEVSLAGDLLPDHLDECAGAVVREAVTNVIRHAPATCCAISVARRSGRVVVEVRNGMGTVPGGATITYGNGLTGLAERVQGVGGVLHAHRRRDDFVLRATMPLRAAT